MDSTKPASRSTRRCLDTIGCGIPSCRSISPTDCCDETRRLSIARRFGSAMISNTDSTLLIYSTEHMPVKVYKGSGPRQRFQSGCGDAPSDAFLAGAIQRAARSGRFSVEAGTRTAAPFPAPLSPLAALCLRCAPDKFLLTKPNTFQHNREASVATLRWCSGSFRNAVRLPFGTGVQLRRNPQLPDM